MVRKIFGRLMPPSKPMDDGALESLLGDPSLLFLAKDMQTMATMAERPGSHALGELVVHCADRAAELCQIYDLSPDQMDLALAAVMPVWKDGEL